MPTQSMTMDYVPAPVLKLGLNDSLTFTLNRAPWTTQGFRCAISGTPGSGKSYLMSVLAEEIHHLGIPFVVVDPEGEHRSLRELGGVLVAGTAEADVEIDGPGGAWIDAVIDRVAGSGCAVLDLADMDEDDGRLAYARFARRFLRAQQLTRQACFLFLEEAHIFAPQKDRKSAQESLMITKQIARRGRKFGINTVAGSQRPGDMEKDILAQANVRFFGRVEIEHDYKAIARYLPRAVPMQTLRDLGTGEFYLSVSGDLHKVTIRERRTTDLGATPPIVARPRGRSGQHSIFEFIAAPESARSMRCR
jgi:DNA helicase HerA-like ATPase